jgi:response regulator RpfG family c-di-GMP phosphodiesterase
MSGKTEEAAWPMTEKILLVDDDANTLTLYEKHLRPRFIVETAQSGEEALKLLDGDTKYAVLVADMHMANMTGIELLEAAQEKTPDTVRIMLSADTDAKTAIDAVNSGRIFKFLTKPFPAPALTTILEDSARQYRLVTAERELLEKTLNESVRVLTELLAMAEPQFFKQSAALRESVQIMADALAVPERWELASAAMLCHIGYLSVPQRVLDKLQSGIPLQPLEQQMVTRVPEIGHKLLEKVPRLETVARTILYQNKHFDGTGFPRDGVAGSNIPMGSRILKIVIDVMKLQATGTTKGKIMEAMKSRSGIYDPNLLKTAITCLIDAPPKGSAALGIKELRVGHVLTAAIETLEGTLLVAPGNFVSDSLLEKIKNFAQLTEIKEPIYVAI